MFSFHGPTFRAALRGLRYELCNAVLSTLDQLFLWTVPVLVVLGIVVIIHELGHFLVARALGVRVETFSIGFGPEIFGFFDRSGTRWRLPGFP